MPQPTLVSIAITELPTKLNYKIGDNFDSTGIVVTGTYSDASTAVETPDSYSGFNSSLSNYGQIITVAKGAFTKTFQVNILSATLLPNALTTIAKVESLISLSTSSKNDALIAYLIDSVTSFIEGFCGNRKFLSQTYTNEIYDSKKNINSQGGSTIFLHQFPVTKLTTVKYRGGTISTPVWYDFDANSYLLYGKSGFVRFLSILPDFPQGLSFTYEAGFKIDFTNEFDPSKHNLPFEITMIATELVAKAYQLRQAHGTSSQEVEGQKVSFATELTLEQKAVLGSYSIARMAI